MLGQVNWIGEIGLPFDEVGIELGRMVRDEIVGGRTEAIVLQRIFGACAGGQGHHRQTPRIEERNRWGHLT